MPSLPRKICEGSDKPSHYSDDSVEDEVSSPTAPSRREI